MELWYDAVCSEMQACGQACVPGYGSGSWWGMLHFEPAELVKGGLRGSSPMKPRVGKEGAVLDMNVRKSYLGDRARR